MPEQQGKVFLIGAGPGDPGLLTLRGAECLREADVVLFDYLASPELLIGTRDDAELICLGRHGRGRIMSQSEINELMIRHARNGRAVARLKGGDPAIFARLSEELSALEAAGISYEIVPGVTAAQAASSHAGIPLTNRDEASCVAFVTGHEMPGKDAGDALNYFALARFPGTLVFYMGITTAGEWSRALVEAGKPGSTPVAIARRCSLPDQEVFTTTLERLGDFVKERQIRPPAVVIVGDVANRQVQSNWFTSQPLFGKTILVTRPGRQSHGIARSLRQLGADVLCQAAIEIGPPRDWAPVDDVIRALGEYHWLVFSSANGVTCFFDRLLATGRDVRALGHAKLAAIGPATVDALAEYALLVDVAPQTYRAEALADALLPHVAGKRAFLARASRGREVLAEMLSRAGAVVTQAVVYESRDVPEANENVRAMLAAGQVDWTTVTSSAIARSLVSLFGESLHKTKLAAISPLTADVLDEAGYSPQAVATDYTTDGIVRAILATESANSSQS